MASLQGDCGLTGQLVSVDWSESSSLWAMTQAKGKKDKNRGIPAFSILCFSPGSLFSLGLLGTSYILKLLLLCHVNLKLAAGLEVTDRHKTRQKDASITMYINSHILGHRQM